MMQTMGHAMTEHREAMCEEETVAQAALAWVWNWAHSQAEGNWGSRGDKKKAAVESKNREGRKGQEQEREKK